MLLLLFVLLILRVHKKIRSRSKIGVLCVCLINIVPIT
jgi:hypothetical protein